ncbi:tRNA (adenosine(37)-N6)-threonylcarbamoyltransferase complex ATPase subunit type 1 TsaE [Lentilactobacillus senioris]|uniref:tRNA (adenosine(37)-N6)-threonylcarbamoyltransferase complex ATPase subunit type 1 TsaE n=1 Tax=Lentilactobacillus senioris TaxID=931534 RepID=UPI002282C0C9|nr:tRNA (adenosine(37)-N6)-threonylcarbamoyltransferase complex ATPase subunit type 1 TsaE [Lentilactobacillus senioris]MCY9807220.1 tRNA (adenosine(37)-N6)-threonylcarbamoyltransferase complex ATPase subunit type 1 TsaE [Lentilactobacillus senioris]
MTQTIKLNAPEQTMALGQKLAQLLQPQDLILLDGDLGAGKTTFTKGLASGLGINRPVKSPTFTIVREYQTGRLPLYHMDVYRLEDGGGEELGLEEYINGDGVVVIEWSEFVAAELPNEFLRIKFERNDENGDNSRVAILSAKGSHYEKLLAELGEV